LIAVFRFAATFAAAVGLMRNVPTLALVHVLAVPAVIELGLKAKTLLLLLQLRETPVKLVTVTTPLEPLVVTVAVTLGNAVVLVP
jgi:hypothetical protein